jgi:hypothetical protein
MSRASLLAIAGLFVALRAGPASGRVAFVCTVTNRLPDYAIFQPSTDDTRVFTITADLLEERSSGTSVIRQWTIVANQPAQIMAISGPPAMDTLLIDPLGKTFAESGLNKQARGYCEINDLP